MASISTRTRTDGTTAWRVNFRLVPGGPPTSETFETAEHADYFAKLVDRIGGKSAREKRNAASQPQSPTLTKALEAYIAQAPDLTAGTAAEYRRVMDRSGLTKRLGDLPVNLIDQEDVRQWLAARAATIGEVTKRHPSPKTLRNEHGLLSTVLGYALEQGHVPVNAAKGIRLPRVTPAPKRVLTDEEFLAIHEHTRERYQSLVRWLALTGMRWGEATALQWGSIRAGTMPQVTVSQAWKHGDGTRVLGAPKTSRGARTITIPDELLAELGDRGQPGDYVFTTERGGPVWHSWFHAKIWRPAIVAAKVTPPPKIHDLRRYCASTLLAAGVPIHVVQARLGHEDIGTTIGSYGFLTPDMQTAGMDRMAELVR